MPEFNFVNAQEMHKKHPSTFEVPSEEEINNLFLGDYCKICAGREQFWVKIIEFDKNEIVGIVNNDLVFTDEHGLRCEDKVKFSPENIYDILKVEN